MKFINLLVVFLCLSFASFAQVIRNPDNQWKGQATFGTNTNEWTPTDSSAWLQIGENGTNKGLLLPRVNDTSVIHNPVLGLEIISLSDSTIYFYSDKWVSLLDLRKNGNFIQNQTISQQNANSWYKKNVIDTITNDTTPSYPFDFTKGLAIFQWDGNNLRLDNGFEGLNLGRDAGFSSSNSAGVINVGKNSGFHNTPSNSYNVNIGDRSGMYQNGTQNVVVGDNSIYGFTGDYLTSIGSSNTTNNDGDSLTLIGYKSGSFSNATLSTFVGSGSGQERDVMSYNVLGSFLKDTTISTMPLVAFSGDSIGLIISDNRLSIDSSYAVNINFRNVKPTISTGDSAGGLSGIIRVLSSSEFVIHGSFLTFGSGTFSIDISTKYLRNSQVFGSNALADKSNQVSLGDDSIIEVKFGGQGNFRFNTSIQPTNGQTLVWDASINQFIPSEIVDSSSLTIDTVKNISDLISYSGNAYIISVLDTLQGGIFYFYQTSTDPDNGIVFLATGKGSGRWIRQYNQSLGVSADWWGERNQNSINDAITYSGNGGLINLTPNKTYILSGSITPKEGQVINGNNATIKRIADSLVILTSDASSTDSFIVVSGIPTSWFDKGLVQVFIDSAFWGGIASGRFISTISSDTVHLGSPVGSSTAAPGHPSISNWPANTTKVRKVFDMFGSSAGVNYQIININFDGNKDSTSSNHSWTVNTTVHISGDGVKAMVSNCKFFNIPNENIVGQGVKIINNVAENTNGSFVHMSANIDNIPTPIPSIISGNNTDSTNQIPDSLTGHSEGAITNSFTPGYLTITGNRFKNGKDAVFGYIRNGTTGDGSYRNVVISNNYAFGFNKIFFSVSAFSGAVHNAGHILIDGNIFDNCDTTDWSSLQSNINDNFDTLMVGNNLLVGGTIWNIPVFNSDGIQRYILNNSSRTPQISNINISGTMSLSTPLGTAGTDSVLIKGSDSTVKSISPTYYKANSDSTGSTGYVTHNQLMDSLQYGIPKTLEIVTDSLTNVAMTTADSLSYLQHGGSNYEFEIPANTFGPTDKCLIQVNYLQNTNSVVTAPPIFMVVDSSNSFLTSYSQFVSVYINRIVALASQIFDVTGPLNASINISGNQSDGLILTSNGATGFSEIVNFNSANPLYLKFAIPTGGAAGISAGKYNILGLSITVTKLPGS